MSHPEMVRTIEMRDRDGSLLRTLENVTAFTFEGTRYGGATSGKMTVSGSEAVHFSALDLSAVPVEIWLWYNQAEGYLWQRFDIMSSEETYGQVDITLAGISTRLASARVEAETTLTSTTLSAIVKHILDNCTPSLATLGLAYDPADIAPLDNTLAEINIEEWTIDASENVFELLTQLGEFGEITWDVGRIIQDDSNKIFFKDKSWFPSSSGTAMQERYVKDFKRSYEYFKSYTDLMVLGRTSDLSSPFLYEERDAQAPAGTVWQAIRRLTNLTTAAAAAVYAGAFFERRRTLRPTITFTVLNGKGDAPAVSQNFYLKNYYNRVSVFDRSQVVLGRFIPETYSATVESKYWQASLHLGNEPSDTGRDLRNAIEGRIAKAANPRTGREAKTILRDSIGIYEIVSSAGNVVTLKRRGDPNGTPDTMDVTMASPPANGTVVLGVKRYQNDVEQAPEMFVGGNVLSLTTPVVGGGTLGDVMRWHNGLSKITIKEDAPVSNAAENSGYLSQVLGIDQTLNILAIVDNATISDIDANNRSMISDVIGIDGDTLKIKLSSEVWDTGTAGKSAALSTQWGIMNVSGNKIAINTSALITDATNSAALSTLLSIKSASGYKVALAYNAIMTDNTNTAEIGMFYHSTDANWYSEYSKLRA